MLIGLRRASRSARLVSLLDITGNRVETAHLPYAALDVIRELTEVRVAGRQPDQCCRCRSWPGCRRRPVIAASSCEG
jgi:hypothetical protein